MNTITPAPVEGGAPPAATVASTSTTGCDTRTCATPGVRSSAMTDETLAFGVPGVRTSTRALVTRFAAISGHDLLADLQGVHRRGRPRDGSVGVGLEDVAEVGVRGGEADRRAVGNGAVGAELGADLAGRRVVLAGADLGLDGEDAEWRGGEIAERVEVQVPHNGGRHIVRVAVDRGLVHHGEVARARARRPFAIGGIGGRVQRDDPA